MEEVEICKKKDQINHHPPRDYRTTDHQMLNREIGKANYDDNIIPKNIIHLQDVTKTLLRDFTEGQRKQAQRLIEENADILSKSEFNIGQTTLANITSIVVLIDHSNNSRKSTQSHILEQ